MTIAPVQTSRSLSLDAIRGLAILVMIVDHTLTLFGRDPFPLSLRYTVTRVSMPLFMLVAGHLVRRLTPRHMLALGWGLLLGVFAWHVVDVVDILVQYVIGAALLVWARRYGRVGVTALLVVALTVSANGYTALPGMYDTAAIVALMAVGQLLPREWFAWGDRFTWRPLLIMGRYPLSIYVCHVAIIVGIGYAIGRW